MRRREWRRATGRLQADLGAMTSSVLVGLDRNEATRAGSSEARSILLVGEDPLLSRALSRLLREAGYQVWTTESWERPNPAETGRIHDLEAGPALVIVDVPDEPSAHDDRPGSSPPFRQWSKAQRILWISGNGEPTPCERRLVKPFTGHQLLTKVEVLLGCQERGRT